MAFDDSGNLIVPAGAFANRENPKHRRKVECPKCGYGFHVPLSRYWATCRECHEVFAL
jgi:hypothetical protein